MSQFLGHAGSLLGDFAANEAGVSAIEYGLLAMGIAVAIVATIAALGTDLTNTFQSVADGVH